MVWTSVLFWLFSVPTSLIDDIKIWINMINAMIYLIHFVINFWILEPRRLLCLSSSSTFSGSYDMRLESFVTAWNCKKHVIGLYCFILYMKLCCTLGLPSNSKTWSEGATLLTLYWLCSTGGANEFSSDIWKNVKVKWRFLFLEIIILTYVNEFLFSVIACAS